MPQTLSLQAEQKIAYLSQLETLENPYMNCELCPLALEQQDQTFWLTPLEGRIACFYCGNRIQGVPYPKPVGFDAERCIFRVQGCYCWLSCVLSCILEKGGHVENFQREWLTLMKIQVYQYYADIRPINRWLFQMYGGPLSHDDYLKKVTSGEPMPIVRLRTGAPFVPVDMLIENQMKSIDFLRLKMPKLAPVSTIQQPFFGSGGNGKSGQGKKRNNNKSAGGAQNGGAQANQSIQASQEEKAGRQTGEIANPSSGLHPGMVLVPGESKDVDMLTEAQLAQMAEMAQLAVEFLDDPSVDAKTVSQAMTSTTTSTLRKASKPRKSTPKKKPEQKGMAQGLEPKGQEVAEVQATGQAMGQAMQATPKTPKTPKKKRDKPAPSQSSMELTDLMQMVETAAALSDLAEPISGRSKKSSSSSSKSPGKSTSGKSDKGHKSRSGSSGSGHNSSHGSKERNSHGKKSSSNKSNKNSKHRKHSQSSPRKTSKERPKSRQTKLTSSADDLPLLQQPQATFSVLQMAVDAAVDDGMTTSMGPTVTVTTSDGVTQGMAEGESLGSLSDLTTLANQAELVASDVMLDVASTVDRSTHSEPKKSKSSPRSSRPRSAIGSLVFELSKRSTRSRSGSQEHQQ